MIMLICEIDGEEVFSEEIDQLEVDQIKTFNVDIIVPEGGEYWLNIFLNDGSRLHKKLVPLRVENKGEMPSLELKINEDGEAAIQESSPESTSGPIMIGLGLVCVLVGVLGLLRLRINK